MLLGTTHLLEYGRAIIFHLIDFMFFKHLFNQIEKVSKEQEIDQMKCLVLIYYWTNS